MASHSVEQVVRTVIGEVLTIDAARIDDGDHIMDDLGADSLHMIEIQMTLEEKLGIEIPDEEADQLHVVGNAVHWIEDHLA